MNPFWATRRMCDSREDHLTEFFAAALALDDGLRTSYARYVLGDFAEQRGWNTPPVIRSVETQVTFPSMGCTPDMVLHLEDGHLIACEHKIDAPETLGTAPDGSEEPARQLAKYLQLPIDGLVYVRAELKAPDKDVLANSLYICPTNREHLLWRDFYPLLAESSNPFTRWLAAGFERLGYTQPHPSIGDLSAEESRQNLWKLWSTTLVAARALGWKAAPGAICEIYLLDHPTARSSAIWISPSNQLLVRSTPRSSNAQREITEAFRSLASASQLPVEAETRSVRRRAGPTTVIDAFASLAAIVGEAGDFAEIDRKLCSFVEPFIRAAT